MHGLYKALNLYIGKEDVCFMTEEHHLSSGNSIYELKRRNH